MRATSSTTCTAKIPCSFGSDGFDGFHDEGESEYFDFDIG
jgi:hypothetical protein